MKNLKKSGEKMRRHVKLSLIALSLALGVTTVALGSSFTFTSIDVPGADFTVASGINDSGTISGRYRAGGVFHCFTFDGVTFTTIDFPGATQTRCHGINASDQVVGDYRISDVLHGFLLDPKDGFTTIDFPGATETLALGINASGQIVGHYTLGGVFHGFMFDGVTFTTIDFPGATQTFPGGINASGQIVGQYEMVAGIRHAFLRNTDGTFTTIDFPGATRTTTFDEGAAITDAGRIVGSFKFSESRWLDGFVRDGGNYSKVDFPFSQDTEPLGINGSGQIVGLYTIGGVVHGFLLEP